MADPDPLPDGDPSTIVRRAPFAQSPRVGRRGQEQQQRIIQAALEVFGDVGYHECAVNRITELAGCSRVSFYQYFENKEDVFRHLSGRVARQLRDAADDLYPVTGDLAGWLALNHWLNRYSQIYDEYEPVFVTFQTAAASDERVATGAARVDARSFADLRAKIQGSPRAAKDVDRVTRTLLSTIARFNRDHSVLARGLPNASIDRRRANVAFTDVFHRALFGPDPAVNIHEPKKRASSKADRSAAPVRSALDAAANEQAPPAAPLGATAARTRAQLVEAGHRVFAERGYYATRVADIVEASGCSHGTFYRYFENKDALFRILAKQASLRLRTALDDLPSPGPDGVTAGADLRSWLRGFASTYSEEAAIFAMWSEAVSRDDQLDDISVAVLEATRQRLVNLLAPRGWGDPDAEALVVLVFLDALTSHTFRSAQLEVIADIIERGMLDGPA